MAKFLFVSDLHLAPSKGVDNFKKDASQIEDIQDAKVLLLLGDSITTDHISPAGKIPA